MTKINLGCGHNKVDGFINIDKFEACQPDLLFDLEQTPWPFADDEITEVLAIHVLEHLGADVATFFRIFQELYRVMAPGGHIRIAVPHHRSDHFSGDPTHVRDINIGVLSLFSKSNCRKWRENAASNSPLADYLDIDFEIDLTEVRLTPHWEAKRELMPLEELNLALDSFNNVAEEVRFRLRKIGRSV